MLFRFDVPGFLNKVFLSRHGLWVPVFDALVPRKRNVLALLCTADGQLLIPASNIVTDAGDTYYAQRAASESPTFTFPYHELASAGNPGKAANRSSFTPITSTTKAHSSGYPKTSDADADNTGDGVDVVTYLTQYAKTDFAASAITHGMIISSAVTSAAILTGYAFAASFNKTTDDTLKLIVNHTQNGV